MLGDTFIIHVPCLLSFMCRANKRFHALALFLILFPFPQDKLNARKSPRCEVPLHKRKGFPRVTIRVPRHPRRDLIFALILFNSSLFTKSLIPASFSSISVICSSPVNVLFQFMVKLQTWFAKIAKIQTYFSTSSRHSSHMQCIIIFSRFTAPAVSVRVVCKWSIKIYWNL